MANRNAVAAAVLGLALGIAAVLAEDSYGSARTTNPTFLEEPTRVIAVRFFQPRVYGGIMIRGRCGTVLLAHREIPADVYTPSSSDEGAPWNHGEAGGVSRSLESFFSLSHPLALFQEDPSELDRWHNARMLALQAIHSQMLRQIVSLGDELRTETDSEATVLGYQKLGASSDADQAYSENANGLSQMEADMAGSQATDLAEDNSRDAAQAEPGMLESMEWTPLNGAGAVLLGMGFGLLVVMLLMSLSTLIYGCSEGDPEPLICVADNTVETPLLEGGGEESEHGDSTSMVNPLANYEPPKEGKQ